MGFNGKTKFLIFLLALLGNWFYLPKVVLAHSIKTDDSVLIMLHASPDDNPIINQPANLTFYITDKQKKFKAAECDCRLEISLNNNVIFSTTTFKIIKNSPVFSYIFPQKGIYTIKLTAQPSIEDGFQEFAFTDDDVDVSRTMEEVRAAKAFFYRLYGVLGAVTILIIIFIKKKIKINN